MEIKTTPYGCLDTDIGRLCVYYTTMNDMIVVDKILGKPIENCLPLDYAKALIRCICHHETKLKEEEPKPESHALSEREVDSLSSEDIESIITIYVENTYTVNSEDSEKKEDKKKEEESYVEYCYRLEVEEAKKREKIFKNLTKSINMFSSPAQKALKARLSFGKQLKGLDMYIPKFKGIDINIPKFKGIDVNIPKLKDVDMSKSLSDGNQSIMHDFAAIERAKEERRLAPMKELSGKFDIFIDKMNKLIDFTVDSNNDQVMIAGEIKRSGDYTFKVTVVILLVTIVGILVAIGGLWYDYSRSASAMKQTNENIELFADKIDSVNSNLVTNNGSINQSLGDLKMENKKLEELIASQSQKIKKLESLRIKDVRRMKELESERRQTSLSK